MKNYYKTLGLEEGASQQDIKSAYIRLTKELDPASNDNLDFFIEEYGLVQEAYKKLTGNQPKEKSSNSDDLFEEEASLLSIIKKFRASNNQDKIRVLTFLEDHKAEPRFNEALNMILKSENLKTIEGFKLKKSANDNYINRKGENKYNTPKTKKGSKNKIYIIIFFLLVAPFGINYLLFKKKLNDFEQNIPKIETDEMNNMEVNKVFWLDQFKKNYPRLKSYFNDSRDNDDGKLNFADAITKKDTLIKFLLFSKKLSFNAFDEDYFMCAYNHEINRYKNKNNKEYLNWYNKTRKKFGLRSKTINYLINIVKKSSSKNSDFPFFNSKNNSDIDECKRCLPNYISSSELDVLSIKEFDGFIRRYFEDKRSVDNNNKEVLKKYNSKLSIYKRNMGSSLIKKLNIKLKSREGIDVLYANNIDYTYSEGITLGPLTYSFAMKGFNEKKLGKIGDDIFKDFYRTNSLSTGSTPYSYCYGRTPYCSPPDGYAECSFIDVKASSTSDVIVLVKKNNIVYSHAYIKAGSYYKFKLGNGSFQTFFYYGNGWNPNKLMKKANCGEIIGGFVSDETLDKSEIINLRNSSMSFSLYSVTNGNFQPKSSNKNEAF